jgi:hypothetical protein
MYLRKPSGFTDWPQGVCGKLMAASRASNTWDRYRAAIRSFEKFCESKNFQCTWPIPVHLAREYVAWALKIKKLSPNTVKLYISDLSTTHLLKGIQPPFTSDFFIKSMIKGAENLSLYSNITKNAKLVMTLPLLKILGHEIACSSWSTDSKRVFWAACCVAFFGSFRMGEILSKNDFIFCSETLTWDCINLSIPDIATVQVKFPKINSNGKSDFIDLFAIKDSPLCPYTCLLNLRDKKSLDVKLNRPVFTFDSGLFLSTKRFNSSIRSLMHKHLGKNAENISGHSFRAGIPAAISNHPSLMSNDDVCKWGRWNSNSFKLYTRLKISARKAIFDKLLSALDIV